MLYDIDSFTKINFEDEPVRVFSYDLFVSHRRFDLPHDLFEKLNASNVKFIWDYNLDLSDRRILQQVGQAIRNSRYLGLYVSENYVDSPWCAAEYLSGLAAEKYFKIERVLVILENVNSINHIPFPLRDNTRILFSADGIQSLANIVHSGNKDVEQNKQGKHLKRFGGHKLGLNIELLAVDERLFILEQRLNWWFQLKPVNLSPKEQKSRELMPLMGEPFSEIELIARELSDCVLQNGVGLKVKEGVSESAFNHIINISELIGTSLIDSNTQKESLNACKRLYDFILKPLLLIISSIENSEKAVSAYKSVCEGLRYSPVKKEVPIYLRVLNESLKNHKNIDFVLSKARVWLLDTQ